MDNGWSWQFDPLSPENPVEITYDKMVVATASLGHADRIVRRLNSREALYEALQSLVDYLAYMGVPEDCEDKYEEAKKALAKAEGKLK